MPSADANYSRRTIRLRTNERTNQRALGDQRKCGKRGEKDGNGGQRETGTRGAKECWAAQKKIVEKSVARFGRTEKAGRREQTRPKGRPSSALPFYREDPTGAEERRRRCCACSSLVMYCKI